jgi:hypothetical protein
MVLWYVVTRSYVVTAVRRPVLRFYGSVVCLVLSYAWYVWSYRMPESMVCVVRCYVWIYGMCGLSCVAKHYGSVVCLVLSYAGQSYDGMVCVAYPASPSTMDLWYVWSDRMSGVWIYDMCGLSCVAKHYGSVVCLVLSYVWLYGMCGISCVAKHYGSGPILCRPVL